MAAGLLSPPAPLLGTPSRAGITQPPSASLTHLCLPLEVVLVGLATPPSRYLRDTGGLTLVSGYGEFNPFEDLFGPGRPEAAKRDGAGGGTATPPTTAEGGATAAREGSDGKDSSAAAPGSATAPTAADGAPSQSASPTAPAPGALTPGETRHAAAASLLSPSGADFGMPLFSPTGLLESPPPLVYTARGDGGDDSDGVRGGGTPDDLAASGVLDAAAALYAGVMKADPSIGGHRRSQRVAARGGANGTPAPLEPAPAPGPGEPPAKPFVPVAPKAEAAPLPPEGDPTLGLRLLAEAPQAGGFQNRGAAMRLADAPPARRPSVPFPPPPPMPRTLPLPAPVPHPQARPPGAPVGAAAVPLSRTCCGTVVGRVVFFAQADLAVHSPGGVQYVFFSWFKVQLPGAPARRRHALSRPRPQPWRPWPTAPCPRSRASPPSRPSASGRPRTSAGP